MRFRHLFMGIGSLLTVLLLLMADPDGGFISNLPFGAGTLSTLIILVTSILFIGLLHLARKALFDYLDLETFAKKALNDSVGAGLIFLGVCVAMLAIAVTILAATS